MPELTDITVIRNLMAKNGFHFSKSLGQNFLVNPSVCPRMAELCGASKGDGVLEIGPGIGVLTKELAKRAGKVVAVELDSRLLPVLSETLAGFDNIKIINKDIMKTDIQELMRQEFSGMDVMVCANLPYYITSPVIMYLLESEPGVKSITAMVQKEAAKRFCAMPGSREAGAVSFAVQYYAKPEIMFEVSAGSFMPRPKVDSAVLRLEIRKTPPVCVADKALFFRCIRAAFGQRRKTIMNALSSGLRMSRQSVSEALASAGIPPESRGENLTLEDFSRLCKVICGPGLQ